jgi:putative glutamine amidotransferase
VSRPVIGICGATEVVRWRAWEVLCNISPRTYSEAVQAAGGIALVLPPDDATAEEPDQMLDLIDGLVLAGGADVDPGTYGARPGEHTTGTWPERDRFELALTHRALERDIPVLGICRGMQMLNVALGGTLEQHVPDAVGHERHREVQGTFSDHDVLLEPGSLAARAVGSESTTVKSHHHQGIDELGDGLRVTGRAGDDELPEAIELSGDRFALGVLWHPEEDVRSRVIASFVDEARERRESAVR